MVHWGERLVEKEVAYVWVEKKVEVHEARGPPLPVMLMMLMMLVMLVMAKVVDPRVLVVVVPHEEKVLEKVLVKVLVKRVEQQRVVVLHAR